MIIQEQIDQLVELRVTGTGYLTEVQPLAERGFYRQKLLVPPDVPENYMEVTAKFKADWESMDHSEPPQSFIDQWNAAAGKYGCYNPETRLFELNGITDITYSEALNIAAHPLGNEASLQGFYASTAPLGMRTNLCIRTTPHVQADCMNMCNLTSFVVFRVNNGFIPKPAAQPGNNGTNGMFVNCNSLKRILGWINCMLKVSDMSLPPNLEEIRLRNVMVDFKMGNCSKISYESLAYLIEYATNTTAITVTVHKNVYAKLTGDTTNSAAAALTPEELAQWSALLDTAAACNIRFAAA